MLCTSRVLALVFAAALALPAVPTPASAGARRRTITLRVRLRVARCGRKGKLSTEKLRRPAKLEPTRDKRWIRRHIASTKKIYKRHGVRLSFSVDTFTPKRCVLLTRAHRHALAQHVPASTITVLVMQRVRDIDTPSYNLMGVHWRYVGGDKRYRGRRWVYLTARAVTPVLAHELGHYFGLRHDKRGGNIMTPGRSDPIWRDKKAPKPKRWRPRFAKWQVRVIRRSAARLARAAAAKTAQ